MKKLLLSLFVLALVPMASFGQTYSFSGTVYVNGVPASDTLICVITNQFATGIDTVDCVMTDEMGFYSFTDLTITSLDSAFLVTAACENTWNDLYLNQLEGAIVDVDCGTLPGSNLIIGSQLLNEFSSYWYFVSNMNTNVETYSWSIEGQNYTTAQVQHSFDTPGMHTITLSVVTYDGLTYSTSITINVSDPSTNCESLFFHYNDSLADGIMFYANTSLGNNLSYYWDFGDGNSSDEMYPVHNFAEDMIYTVCLTITGELCEATYCVDVNPEEDGNGLITNGDNEAEAVGTSKSSGFQFVVVPIYAGPLHADNMDVQFEMSLYPNPTFGNVNLRLDLPAADNGTIHVTDVTGKIVSQQSISVGTGSVINLNFNQLPAGIYLVQYQGKMNSKVLKMAIKR